MRKALPKLLAILLFCFCQPAALRAELLSQALLAFPASTQSLEYDNLAQLRKLPNYATLRQQYSGAGLARVEGIFSSLGITEESMQEVVSTIGAEEFYGIVSGTFSASRASKRAEKLGFRQLLIGDKPAICSGAFCVIFLRDSIAGFGGAAELQAMLDAWGGNSPRLGARTPVSRLLAKADRSAPVIGVAPGDTLAAWMGDGIPNGLLSQANLSSLLSGISRFEYSVRLDGKAHLDLNLECASSLTAVALSQSLSAINALTSVATSFSKGGTAPPFEHMSVSSNERIVHLTLDASITVH